MRRPAYTAFVVGESHETHPGFMRWCESNGYDPTDPEIQKWWDEA